jgi:hypothetical protein
MKGEASRNRATIKEAAARGRVKNMEKSPWDMIRDLRRLFSMSGPRTKARTRGGPLVIKLLPKVAHDSKEDHDVNIKESIAHAVVLIRQKGRIKEERIL